MIGSCRIFRGSIILTAAVAATIGVACSPHRTSHTPAGFESFATYGERARILDLYPGVTATIVAPATLDARRPIDLILYALPNGNTTAQTIGRTLVEGLDWHFDIQHIGAQTRALRSTLLPQAVVVYLEANTRSWPEWRRVRGYEKANRRIVELVDEIRTAMGNELDMRVTLTGHSGGGSFMFGFIEGQDSIPRWVERIAFLDANYNFDTNHGEKLVRWLRGNPRNRLVVLAYDDRNIMLNGKRVVSDSGGTWRASSRMMNYLREPFAFTEDSLGEFRRYHARQVEMLLHPNPANRILHTEMIGEMNGYMHAMLVGRPEYSRAGSLLKHERAYTQWVNDGAQLPPARPAEIPTRRRNAIGGTQFILSMARLSREDREAAIRRELLAGNIPSFLRRLQAVQTTAPGESGVRHTVSYEVMPDYLAIGSDDDYVRMPMTPYTAQAFADAFGFVLPTRKMVNDIWAASKLHLEPRPLSVERESPLTFLKHHRIIEEQLKGMERGSFVAGIKKDLVVTPRLRERPNRVAIYGWHCTNGVPIQPVYIGHVDWYVDYSHGARPVRQSMQVDGIERSFESIMNDPELRYLLSDEGEPVVTRYDK